MLFCFLWYHVPVRLESHRVHKIYGMQSVLLVFLGMRLLKEVQSPENKKVTEFFFSLACFLTFSQNQALEEALCYI